MLGLVDVEANYAAVRAFRGECNFAERGLILHMTIPFVSIFSFVFLRTRYTLLHMLGCAFAIVGVVVIFSASTIADKYSDQMVGNLWSFFAAFLYAISNLMNEYCVKKGGLDTNIESLGKMGLSGMIWSIIQVACLEWDPVTKVVWNSNNIAWTCGYVFSLMVFYCMVSVYLRVTESLMFNLSLLTSDLYNALFSNWIFKDPVTPLFWLAWVLEIIGIGLYSYRDPFVLPEKGQTLEEIEYKAETAD